MSESLDAEALRRLFGGKVDTIPPCAELLQGVLVEIVAGERVTHVFPVLERFTNVVGSMQGGFITAAFDNVFGHLGYMMSNGRQIATLDISTTYLRPIFPGDKLRVSVILKHCGKTVAYMEGEATNLEGQIIACAQTHVVFLEE